MRNRNRKLTLTEIILGVNVSYTLFLGQITLCLYPLKSLTRIDKIGNLIGIFFLAIFILLSIYASIYSNKTIIYNDSVLNNIGDGKLIFISILGLSAIVPFLIYFKYKPTEEFFLYIFFSITFIFSLLQTVFFYKPKILNLL